jgi:ATP-binding cassette, subfamily B, bacterial PglK
VSEINNVPDSVEIKNWRQLVPAAFGLLTRREKRRAIAIAMLLMLSHFLDSIALAGIMPLVGVVVEPELLKTHEGMRWLHQAMGEPALSQFITWLAMGAILLIVLGKVGQFIMQDRVRRFVVSCQNRMSREIMARILAAPYEWHLKRNAAVSAHHISTDILMWANDAILRTLNAVGYAFLLLTSMGILVYCAPWAGLLGMAGVGAVAALLLHWVNGPLLRFNEQRRLTSARFTASANQIFTGIKDIKLSGREASFMGFYSKYFGEYGRSGVVLRFIQALPPMVMILLGQSALVLMVLILWHGGGSGGEISAQMALLVLVTSRAIPGANRFISEASGMQAAVPSVRAILALKDLDSGLSWGEGLIESDIESPGERWRHIRWREVSYRYPGSENFALNNISLEIQRGGSYGLAGSSGAGKSTAIDILVGLLSPSEGSIKVDSGSSANLHSAGWRGQIGYVPQEAFIADATLRANVAFGMPADEVDEARVRECLELANLGAFLSELKAGLDTGLGDCGKRMSGGQKQRVAIARALYRQPALLVLDEATSALDAENERAIQEALENLQGRLTVVIIAHRLTTLRRCDTIFLLDQGKLVAQGTHAELMKSNTLFQSLAGETPVVGAQRK